jgi:hypothetical protein
LDSKQPSGNEARIKRIALASVLALTTAWSSNALSRTQPAAECAADVDLQTLTAPIEPLVLKKVDHVPTETDVASVDSIDIERVTADTSTPLLNLAPRTDEAIRSIFADDSAELAKETAGKIQVSPVAESEPVPDLSELPDDGSGEDVSVDESDLPLLERQMYRIDI